MSTLIPPDLGDQYKKTPALEIDNQTKRITLDELPKFSAWPKRLLSLESFDVKYKTEKEVLREYQDEEWGSLLERVRQLNNPTPLQIEEEYINLNEIIPCYLKGDFYLAKARQIQESHLELYLETLKPYINDASCLVELGAGYGSKLMNLAQFRDFSGLPLIACEFTKSGRELVSILAKAHRKSVDVGYCDFRNMKIEDVKIPENAIIFTSYSVHYVPELSMEFTSFLSRLKPRVVVHFEPCYENFSLDSVHGMMCRRYMELNDYTRNLITVINDAKKNGLLTLRNQKNVLGSNPFLPISVLEWAPSTKKIKG